MAGPTCPYTRMLSGRLEHGSLALVGKYLTFLTNEVGHWDFIL